MRNFWLRIWIQDPKFSLVANFHIPRVRDFDFMAIMNFKICVGSDSENCPVCDFTSSVIIHGQNSIYICNFVIPIKLKSPALRSLKFAMRLKLGC